jgi:hypothetical protein
MAGDLWEWARDNTRTLAETDIRVTVGNGHRDTTTWSDNYGNRREVWEWAPGHFQIDDN